VLTLSYASKDVYFGGRVIWQNGKAVVQDRLGSVMARGNGSGVGRLDFHDYFPYGEERTATVGDRNKFGTYRRDQTGLDYADQRYYNSAIGRFMSSDPYEASGGAGEPGSWGRGGYVGGDPINYNDPRGLESCPATEQISTTFNGITYPTTIEYRCYEFGYIRTQLGSEGWNAKVSIHQNSWNGFQDIYESGFCVTSEGIPCYQVDIAMRYFSQFSPESCSIAQNITTPWDCETGMALATPLGRSLRQLGFAWFAAAKLVGEIGEYFVGKLVNLTKNTTTFRAGSFARIPGFVDPVKKAFFESKNVGELTIGQQIIETAAIAAAQGYSYTIYVASNTYISPSTQARLGQMGISVLRW